MANEAAHLDFITLKLFVAAVEEGSIARAAMRENITTSAVSKRITELEAYFNTALLIRNRQGVKPTSAGVALLKQARSILGTLSQISGEMREFSDGVRGQVRITANESSTIGYLPEDISKFLSIHPSVGIDVEMELSGAVVRTVIENGADIGVFTGEASTETLDVFHYRNDQLVAVVPSDYRYAKSDGATFSEFLDTPIIGSESMGAIESAILLAASREGKRLRTRIRVGSFDAACRFVEAGLGVAVVTRAVAEPLTKMLDIKFITLTDQWANRTLKICVRNRASLPAATALFLEHLLAHADIPSMVDPS